MSDHNRGKPAGTLIQPKDRVRIDGSARIYTVQAVSRARQDAYLTEGDDTSIGTWVDISQISRVDGGGDR